MTHQQTGRRKLTEAELIANYISKNGIKIIPAGVRALHESHSPFRSRRKNCDWMRGRKHRPSTRYKLAKIYAHRQGEAEPRWTDHKEAELLKLRADGCSWRKLAAHFQMTKAAVQSRWRYLSLGRRLSSQAAITEAGRTALAEDGVKP